MSEILRDKAGNKIAEIKEESGRLILKDKIGNRLGYYNMSTNITYDKIGNKVGTGNLLTTLLDF